MGCSGHFADDNPLNGENRTHAPVMPSLAKPLRLWSHRHNLKENRHIHKHDLLGSSGPSQGSTYFCPILWMRKLENIRRFPQRHRNSKERVRMQTPVFRF